MSTKIILFVDGSTPSMLPARPISEKIPKVSDCAEITRQIANWGLQGPRAIRAAYCSVPVVPRGGLKIAITPG